MRIPDSLVSLVDDGIIDSVDRPLMSGKEAQVYLVRSGGEQRVAKIYKEAQNRSFKQRAAYTEGRQTKNSRDQRAIEKRTKHGRAQDEASWRSTEVDVIYRLRAAGVRVPIPYNFIDGVLVMELVTDEDGNPAPRLGDVRFTPNEALAVFDQLLAEVVKMLCAGVVHGDLSDFNVLMTERGPVVIDFPQALDAAKNANARAILIRDVANLERFIARYFPDRPQTHYAEEMWDLFTRDELRPDSKLTGRYRRSQRSVDMGGLLRELAYVEQDEARRREKVGAKPLAPARPDHTQAPVASTGPRRRVEVLMAGPSGRPSNQAVRRPEQRPREHPQLRQPHGHQQPQDARSQPQQYRSQAQHAQPQQMRSQPQHAQQMRSQPQHAQPYQPRPQPQHAQPYQPRPQPQHAQPYQPRPQSPTQLPTHGDRDSQPSGDAPSPRRRRRRRPR